MYQKMKLTNLRQFETSKEEMGFIKGGDDPKRGFLCSAGCGCTSACMIENQDQEQNFTLVSNHTNNSSGMNKVWGVITLGLSHLF